MNIALQKLSNDIRKEINSDVNKSHGYDKKDILAAASILHFIIMDVSAPYLLSKIGVESASFHAFVWGSTLHEQILKMTGVDTHKSKK